MVLFWKLIGACSKADKARRCVPACHASAGACPLIGRYTIAGWYPGGACPFVGNAVGTGYFAAAEAGVSPGSSEYPAAGERVNTLSRGPYLTATAPPTTPAAAPAAAARPIPGNMNGKPIPAPTSAAANGTAAGASIGADPSIAAGPAAAQPQLGGTANAPTEAARPRPAKPPKPGRPPKPPPKPPANPDPSAAGAAAAAATLAALAADWKPILIGVPRRGPSTLPNPTFAIPMPSHTGAPAYSSIRPDSMPPSDNPPVDKICPPGNVMVDDPVEEPALNRKDKGDARFCSEV